MQGRAFLIFKISTRPSPVPDLPCDYSQALGILVLSQGSRRMLI